MFIVSGCKKETNEANPSNSNKDVLISPTIPDYATVYAGPENEIILQFNSVEDWENTLIAMGSFNDSLLHIYESSYPGYVSQRMFFETVEEIELGNLNEDAILASNLSSSGIVIIANKAYMPDFEQDLIYVCKTVNLLNLTNLKNKEVTDTTIFSVYDAEIEVLHLDEATENELKLKVQEKTMDRRKCNEDRAKKRKDPSGNLSYCSNSKKLEAKVVYQNAGIWFSLLMNVDHYQKNGIGAFRKQAKDIFVKYTYRAKKRCGTEWNSKNTSYPNFNFQNIDSWSVRIHHGTKALSKYDLEMTAGVADDCGTPSSTISWSGKVLFGY
jgi:hypothetical protein